MTIVRCQHRLGRIDPSRRRHPLVAQSVDSSSARRFHGSSGRYFASNHSRWRWDELVDSLRSATAWASSSANSPPPPRRSVTGASSEKITSGMKFAQAAKKATDDARRSGTRSTADAGGAIEDCARRLRESVRDAEGRIREDVIDKKESARAIAKSAISRARDGISNRISSSIIPSTTASVISRLRDGISTRMPSSPSMSHVKQRAVEMSTVAIRWLWWWGLAAVGVYGISTTVTKEGMRMLKEGMASPSMSSTPSRGEEQSKSR